MSSFETTVADEKTDLLIAIKKPRTIILVVVMLFFSVLLFRNAWIGDDAFITMRVADNAIHGLGLVWNPMERVQVYTHPLWLLVIIPTYALLGDPHQTLYLLSFGISLAVIYLFLRRFAVTWPKMLIGGLLLASSMAFIDFSSSGLENPLTHLLLILALIVVLQKKLSLHTITLTAFLASFSAVNRLDTLLFYLPILAFQLYGFRRQWRKALPAFLLGFLPLILWELFSLTYYGFLFPNTYYTKLAAVDAPAAWFHENAWHYFRNSFQWDAITLITIGLAIGFTLWERNRSKIMLVLGMVCYLLYIYSIGGDFMSGRFFSALFLTSAVLLMTIDFNRLPEKIHQPLLWLAIIGMLFLGFTAKFTPLLTQYNDFTQEFDQGVANEKLFYYIDTSWYTYLQKQNIFIWGQEGMAVRQSGRRYIFRDSVGFFGFYAGPDVYIMDSYAIIDPLRSKIAPRLYDRIGHLKRPIPLGYEETIKDNFTNHIVHPDLHLYYDKLSILIHADIFTPGRFREILLFNLGQYDNMIKSYNESPEPK